MIFYMIQNFNNEYPELEPYPVLDIKDEKKTSYSRCDEYGISNFVPGSYTKPPKSYFLPANEDVLWAFLGEKEEIKGRIFLIVKEIKEE